MRVEFDRYSLRVDKQRVIVRAGTLSYFRLPARELWRERIVKMRDAGLNAIDVYYPWNFHSERAGEYDFAELRDVEHLHDLIEASGMWLIARPGPYICAELDLGGLPAYLLRDPQLVLRCRRPAGFAYSGSYMAAVREWFGAIVPRIASRQNLLLFQIENEYSVPAHLAALSTPLADLLIRWLGSKRLTKLASSPWLRRRVLAAAEPIGDDAELGQRNTYMRELYELSRRLGVRVPIFHNDVAALSGRQLDVDLLAIDRYPITSFESDWRARPSTFDDFAVDESALDAHGRTENPVFYPELQAGWYDGWGGVGYDKLRERLGPDAIDATTKAALAARGTLWNYYVFSGGTTFGYLASPDVYSSYDYGAPVGESGATDARYDAVRNLNAFIAEHEADLAETDLDADARPLCAQHFCSRVGRANRYVFLRNPTRARVELSLAEPERAWLAPWETQIRVYDRKSQALVGVSPELPVASSAARALPPLLPRLESFRFSNASPQLGEAYDDSAWQELPARALDENRLDLDALGLHYGCVWFRGTYEGRLDRLVLDARHLWSVWIDGAQVASGAQLRNTLGVGADGARARRIDLRRAGLRESGRHALVILVESLGHNKGFADDFRNPRGIASLDTGASRVQWRYRGGLLRGEQGLTPRVDFARVERAGASSEVVLPHGWQGAPEGVALYETSFRLEGVDPKRHALALAFDPGRGRANLYLNGWLLGRSWPERGPQRRFWLPWGVLSPDDENQLAVTVWKSAKRAALGKLRLECV
ncbi:MAG: beta-galactosidase [Myxococcota bacterium]